MGFWIFLTSKNLSFYCRQKRVIFMERDLGKLKKCWQSTRADSIIGNKEEWNGGRKEFKVSFIVKAGIFLYNWSVAGRENKYWWRQRVFSRIIGKWHKRNRSGSYTVSVIQLYQSKLYIATALEHIETEIYML